MDFVYVTVKVQIIEKKYKMNFNSDGIKKKKKRHAEWNWQGIDIYWDSTQNNITFLRKHPYNTLTLVIVHYMPCIRVPADTIQY